MKQMWLAVVFAFCYTTGFSTVITIPAKVDWVRLQNSLPAGGWKQTYNVLYVNARPGDTLVLDSGTRGPLRVDSLAGDSLHPLVFINSPQGKTTIAGNSPTTYYGLTFYHCRYIQLSGHGCKGIEHGIHITGIAKGAGLGIGHFSSNFEVKGIEISNVHTSGITCKTDPECSTIDAYKTFVMRDLKFHHNYIHHVGNEGFYIGHTGYNDGRGVPLSCAGAERPILPHKIIGVAVYNNVVDSTGWDAIQVSAAEGFKICGNYITHDSYAQYPNQQSGIMVGQPSMGDVYGNFIKNGQGIGIQCLGTGNRIYNNFIQLGYLHGAAHTGKLNYAIYINDKVCADTAITRLPYVVAHNTVVIGHTYPIGAPYNTFAPQGINLNAVSYVKGSFLGNNLVVIDTNLHHVLSQPINGRFNTLVIEGYPLMLNAAFISCNTAHTVLDYNFCSNEVSTVGFANPAAGIFKLLPPSPAVDAALAETILKYPFLNTDLDGKPRPAGVAPDFGCWETVK